MEVERRASSHQYYLGNSAILITELTDEAGATLRITDCAPRFKHYERVARYRAAALTALAALQALGGIWPVQREG